jgi:hypothetical protein
VSIFAFGILVDMETQRRIHEMKVGIERDMINESASVWSPKEKFTTAPSCTWDNAQAEKSKVKLDFPGSLYFRSICETGSDAPSLTLKAKSISCRLWQQLEAYLDRELSLIPSKHCSSTTRTSVGAQDVKYPTQYI